MFERSQDLLSITMATRVGQERRYFTAMLILQTSGAESPIFHSESIAAYASPPVRGFPGVHRENSSHHIVKEKFQVQKFEILNKTK